MSGDVQPGCVAQVRGTSPLQPDAILPQNAAMPSHQTLGRIVLLLLVVMAVVQILRLVFR
ncbi:hypothetical protein [Siccirubricoccus sp. G192]|uniref:hypothetical protein n=1 Tax=Siccirubricoccus sp. G192 TaxID=2849651 RepID=UPI001C2C5645|nr:hypothetical protein [Siccirubricoccus sp. G192]MBV1795828.1 hypothetical protein [Siccirubricoccus sp. G192]